MKPIISFTLFGTDEKYYTGAVKNLKLNKELLPNWETYIYYHDQLTNVDRIKELIDLGGKLINVKDFIFDGINVIDFPFFWRFLAFFEDNTVIVRDLDSRMSKREVEYIKGWLDSDRDYFIIRDHPWHSPVPAGLLGMKKRINSFEEYFRLFVKTESLAWGADQEILRKYFYEIEKVEPTNIYYCGYDNQENYIPRDDKDFYIGMQLDEHDLASCHNAIHSIQYLKDINL